MLFHGRIFLVWVEWRGTFLTFLEIGGKALPFPQEKFRCKLSFKKLMEIVSILLEIHGPWC